MQPTNSWETFYSVLLLLTGMLFSCIVVSLFSMQFVQIIVSRRHESEQIEQLEQFFEQQAVPITLASRIQDEAIRRLHRERRLTEQDVPILKHLPSSLFRELICAVRVPHISKHALMLTWAEVDYSAIEELCYQTFELVFLPPGEHLFLAGECAIGAYVFTRGSLDYTQRPGTSRVLRVQHSEVECGNWLSEAALWSQWVHVGRIRSGDRYLTESQVFSLVASSLFECLKKYEVIAALTMTYGRNFHVRIVSAVPPHAVWPDDLHVPSTDGTDLLSWQVGVRLLSKKSLPGVDKEELETELREGKCVIEMLPDRELQRIVSVAALRITNSDEQILAELGTLRADDGQTHQTSAGCKLPGTKRKGGELPQDALQRALHRLGPEARNIDIRDVERSVWVKKSPTMSIGTKYLRTVHHATWPSTSKEMPFKEAGVRSGTLDGRIVSTKVYLRKESRDAKTWIAYAWLDEDVFDYLSSSEGKDSLNQWMKLIQFDTGASSETLELNDTSKADT